MDSRPFSFPPPPPPPPQSQQQSRHPHPQAFGSQSHSPLYGRVSYTQRGGNRGGSAYHRGRGRGETQRDGRGGYSGNNNLRPAYNQHATPTAHGGYLNHYGITTTPGEYTPPQTTFTPAAPSHSIPHSTHGYSLKTPPIPPLKQSNHNSGYGPPPISPENCGVPFAGSQGLVASYRPGPAVQTPSHHSGISHPSPSAIITPPVHWNQGKYADRHQHHTLPPDVSGNGNLHASGTGDSLSDSKKRTYASVFDKPVSKLLRVHAPPAVPGFGNPLLPPKPPPQADAARQPKKKKRLHNKLGLTPKTDGNESSEEEEEDDVDDELRLSQNNPIGPLIITYRGKTSSLGSPADIAAWIEERRKCYPTKARIAEKQKILEESKKARNEMHKRPHGRGDDARHQNKESRVKVTQGKQIRKEPSEDKADPADMASRARAKVEKLRKKLMKEEKRMAEAEAEAEAEAVKARLEAEVPATSKNEAHNSSVENKHVAVTPQYPAEADNQLSSRLETEDAKFTERSSPEAAASSQSKTPGQARGSTISPNIQGNEKVNACIAGPTAILDLQDDSDQTSSSGSDISTSDSESDESDGASAPEESSSRLDASVNSVPTARVQTTKKDPCHQFVRAGHCSRGNRCRFSHDLSPGTARRKPQNLPQTMKKGLFQLLQARQREDEDKRVMQAISWLGEHGILED